MTSNGGDRIVEYNQLLSYLVWQPLEFERYLLRLEQPQVKVSYIWQTETVGRGKAAGII